jgi:hypothetical protein
MLYVVIEFQLTLLSSIIRWIRLLTSRGSKIVFIYVYDVRRFWTTLQLNSPCQASYSFL